MIELCNHLCECQHVCATTLLGLHQFEQENGRVYPLWNYSLEVVSYTSVGRLNEALDMELSVESNSMKPKDSVS